MKSIIRIQEALLARARNLFWKCMGVRIAGYCRIGKLDIPHQHERIEIGAASAFEDGCAFVVSGEKQTSGSPAIKIGPRCYLNRGVILDGSNSLSIGADVMIGPHTFITDHDHALSGDRSRLVAAPVVIEDGVWIGAHVSILKGVTLGTGAVVGAGSVVTHSIPAGTLACGNPAKVIKTLP